MVKAKGILVSQVITSCVDEPFTVFECEKFLSVSEFAKLKSEFPWESIIKSSENESFRYRIDEYGHPDLFKQVLRSRPNLTSLVESVHSHKFVRDLLRTFRKPILARLDPKARVRRVFLRFAPTWIFDTKVDLTVYTRGFHLTPHTDGTEKVIALLLYFEDPGIEHYQMSDAQSLGGTQFWRARHKTAQESWVAWLLPADPLNQPFKSPLSLALSRKFDRTDEMSEEFADFQKDFEVFFISEARDNHLAGFVKSSNSWHSVNLSDYPENVLRGAILINLNLPPTSFRRCVRNFFRQYGLGRLLK